jgi:hypothetical protein
MQHVMPFSNFVNESAVTKAELSKLSDSILLQMIDILGKAVLATPEDHKFLMELVKEKAKRKL